MGRGNTRGPAGPLRGPCGAAGAPDPPHHAVPGASSMAALPVSRQPLPRRAPGAVVRSESAHARTRGPRRVGGGRQAAAGGGTCWRQLPGVTDRAEGSAPQPRFRHKLEGLVGGGCFSRLFVCLGNVSFGRLCGILKTQRENGINSLNFLPTRRRRRSRAPASHGVFSPERQSSGETPCPYLHIHLCAHSYIYISIYYFFKTTFWPVFCLALRRKAQVRRRQAGRRTCGRAPGGRRGRGLQPALGQVPREGEGLWARRGGPARRPRAGGGGSAMTLQGSCRWALLLAWLPAGEWDGGGVLGPSRPPEWHRGRGPGGAPMFRPRLRWCGGGERWRRPCGEGKGWPGPGGCCSPLGDPPRRAEERGFPGLGAKAMWRGVSVPQRCGHLLS